MAQIFLKPGKDKSIKRRHPWIFTGAIRNIKGDPGQGETLDIHDSKGRFLGKAAYSPRSQIAARMWHFGDEQQAIDEAWFRETIQRALALRAPLHKRSDLDAYRLIHGESDGLPGLIVDKYKDWLVCQVLAAGTEANKELLAKLLLEETGCKGIYERSDAQVRGKEGLEQVVGVLAGDTPPEQLVIQEGPVSYQVDVYEGHKTGFYLDQRDSRAAVRDWSEGKEVLNCFSYTGGFGIAAGAGGAAHVTHVDTSGAALATAAQNLTHNQLETTQHTFLEADVFKLLRQFRKEERSFDLIVMDPPKFIEAKRHLEKGCRGYKDINLLAFQLLRPGGQLFTFSCSGLMAPDLFQKVVADAALDAGCQASILTRLQQPPDHPIALPFPESAYLKGLLCQKATSV